MACAYKARILTAITIMAYSDGMSTMLYVNLQSFPKKRPSRLRPERGVLVSRVQKYGGPKGS